MKKAFTLVELVVAIAILVLITSFAGAIFRVSIDSHRTGLANIEIMQKLRAITDQLNRDFKGIQKDAPMAIQFRLDNMRRDSMAFFVNGDFQSIRQYWRAEPNEQTDSNDLVQRTVRGNIASIYYGLASDSNILARKQKILTSDPYLIDRPSLIDANEFLIDSLSIWRTNLNDISFASWTAPSFIDLHQLERDLPLYMIDGIDNFTIQMSVWDSESQTFIWFPDGSFFDDNEAFGFFYNIPKDISFENWHNESLNWPRALKFTFTLYDSSGIIENGRTFTHIVYLGD